MDLHRIATRICNPQMTVRVASRIASVWDGKFRAITTPSRIVIDVSNDTLFDTAMRRFARYHSHPGA